MCCRTKQHFIDNETGISPFKDWFWFTNVGIERSEGETCGYEQEEKFEHLSEVVV